MGWMHLTILTQINHSYFDTRQRRTKAFLTFVKKDRFLDLMIINFENTASRQYFVQKSKVYEGLDQK